MHEFDSFVNVFVFVLCVACYQFMFHCLIL